MKVNLLLHLHLRHKTSPGCIGALNIENGVMAILERVLLSLLFCSVEDIDDSPIGDKFTQDAHQESPCYPRHRGFS